MPRPGCRTGHPAGQRAAARASRARGRSTAPCTSAPNTLTAVGNSPLARTKPTTVTAAGHQPMSRRCLEHGERHRHRADDGADQQQSHRVDDGVLQSDESSDPPRHDAAVLDKGQSSKSEPHEGAAADSAEREQRGAGGRRHRRLPTQHDGGERSYADHGRHPHCIGDSRGEDAPRRGRNGGQVDLRVLSGQAGAVEPVLQRKGQR